MMSSYGGTCEVKHWRPVGRTLVSALFAVVVIMSATSAAMAAEGDLVWAKSAGGPGWSPGVEALSALHDGTAFVTGELAGPTTFGAGEPNETILENEGIHADAFVAKYTPYGTLEWVKRITGDFVEEGTGIAALRDGGAVVTGMFGSSVTLGEGEPNETTFEAASYGDEFVAKYNGDGTLAWAKRITDVSLVGLGRSDISVLPDGGCLVTGAFMRGVTFSPGEPNQTTLYGDGIGIFVARYSANGALMWAKQASGQSSGVLRFAIAALPDGGGLVTGGFDETWTFGSGEPNQTTLTAAEETSSIATDVLVARYNPDGTLAWARRDGGKNYEKSRAVAGLPDGGALVTGYFGRHDGAVTATFGEGEPNETTLTSSDEYDMFVAKYGPDGTLTWAKRAGGTGDDYGLGIATFSDGSGVVSGYFSVTATFGQGEPKETTLTAAGGSDIFFAKYNSDGTLAWVKRAGGTNGDYAVAVSALADGGSLVTGGFAYGGGSGGTAIFGPGEPNETMLTNEEDVDLFLARFEGWRAPDLDGDGLPDAVETDTGTYNGPTDTGTDPLNPDTDGDGLEDGDEVHDLDPDTPGVQNPFHPLDPDSTGDNFQDTPDGVPDGQNDYDGDGQSNAYELEYGSNPLDPASVVPAVTRVGAFALVALVVLLVLIRQSIRAVGGRLQ